MAKIAQMPLLTAILPSLIEIGAIILFIIMSIANILSEGSGILFVMAIFGLITFKSQNVMIIITMIILSIIILNVIGIIILIYWWKIFGRLEKPKWWSLLSIIPFIGILLHYVFIGIAAFNKND